MSQLCSFDESIVMTGVSRNFLTVEHLAAAHHSPSDVSI